MPRLESLVEEVETRPFVAIAVPVIAGIACASSLPLWAGWIPLGVGAVVALGGRRRRRLLLAGGALAAFGAGAARQACNDRPASDDVAMSAPAARAEIVGIVAEPPRRFAAIGDVHESHAPPGGFFVLEAHEVTVEGRRRAASGRVRIQYYEHRPGFTGGETVHAVGRLRIPDPPSNPGTFDRAAALRREGVRSILVVGRDDPLSLRAPAPIMSPGRALTGLRDRLRALLAAHAPAEVAALQSALLLGSREELPDDFTRALQRTGTAHFLAISGLNLVLVLTVFWVGLVLLGLRADRMNAVLILLLLGYTAMTGWQVSVVRAFLMSALVLAGVLVGRRSDILNSLAFAAAIVLAVDPDQLFQPGFQLSFAAVAGIVLVSPVFHDFLAPSAYGTPIRWWSAAGRKLRGGLAVSLAAWLATAPIVVATFHLVTPVIVIANFALGPLMTAQVALGMATLPAAAVFPPLADGLGLLSWAAYSAMAWTAEVLTRLPAAYLFTPSMPVGMIAAYYVGLAAWTAWARGSPSRWKPWLALLFAGALSFPPVAAPRGEYAVFGIIDVGRGSCAYLRQPDGTVTVFDCGSRSSRDAGAHLAAPVLWSRGIVRVHTLVLSQADAGRANGARSLIERMGVRRLVTPPGFDDAALLEWARSRGLECVEARRGTPVPGLEILGPPDPASLPGPWPANQRSLVVRARTPHGSVLLLGGIGERGAAALVDSGIDLRSDVLVPSGPEVSGLQARLTLNDPDGWLEVELAPEGPRVIAGKHPAPGAVR